jgi:plastocyanin
MRQLGYMLSLIMVVGLVSCGGKKDEDEDQGGDKSGENAAPATVATVDMANGATINGTVKLDGAAPVGKVINMAGDSYCSKSHSAPVMDAQWVSTNGTLSNAFVYVKDGLGGKTYAAPTTPVNLTQHGCMYEPHVFGVMIGQTLHVDNQDQTLHNIHSHATNNDQFNEAQPNGTPAKEYKLTKQEVMVPIKCDVHSWMSSYGGVLPHPFFAVTGADGKYEIKGVPAGDYTVECWHESTKMDGTGVTQDQKVTVAAKDTKTVDFSLKAQ